MISWRHGAMVISTTRLYSTKAELWLSVGSNTALRHSFSTFAKLTCVYQGAKNVSFSENVANALIE